MRSFKRNMLVIDDDRAILHSFSRILEKNGYSVAIAETGKEAEEKLGKQGYVATLVDVKLPDMDGVDLLPFMQEVSPKMVKIVMTGTPSPDYARRAANNGADAFLSKPIEPGFLLSILKRKLEERDA